MLYQNTAFYIVKISTLLAALGLMISSCGNRHSARDVLNKVQLHDLVDFYLEDTTLPFTALEYDNNKIVDEDTWVAAKRLGYPPSEFPTQLGDELYEASMDTFFTMPDIQYGKVYQIEVLVDPSNDSSDRFTQCHLLGTPEDVLYKDVLDSAELTHNYLISCPSSLQGLTGRPVAGEIDGAVFLGMVTQDDVDRHTAPYYIPVNNVIQDLLTTQAGLSTTEANQAIVNLARIQVIGKVGSQLQFITFD